MGVRPNSGQGQSSVPPHHLVILSQQSYQGGNGYRSLLARHAQRLRGVSSDLQ